MICAVGISVILGKRRVLDALDMTAESGEVTGIIGPNGSGKTTLLRVLAGVLAPTAGQIRLDGGALTALSPSERSRRLAYLPQGGEVAWPLLGRELVALGRLPWRAGIGGALSRLSLKDRAAVALALERAACAAFADRRFSDLSGGEKARLLLARALATEAPVLLADEPAAALDPGHQVRILSLLREEARRGVSVVLILHDLSLAARFCDRLWLLCNGRVAGAGRAAELLGDSRLEASFGTDFYRDFSGPLPVLLPL